MRPWLSCWCCYKLHCTTTSVKTATSSQPLRSKSCQNAKLTLCEEMNIIHHCNCVGKLEAANASLVDQRWLQWQSSNGSIQSAGLIGPLFGYKKKFLELSVLLLSPSGYWLVDYFNMIVHQNCSHPNSEEELYSCTRVQRTPLAATIHVHSSCHQVVQETNSVNFTVKAA